MASKPRGITRLIWSAGRYTAGYLLNSLRSAGSENTTPPRTKYATVPANPASRLWRELTAVPFGLGQLSQRVGVDLIAHPVLGDQQREQRPAQPEHPAPAPPGLPGRGLQQGKLHHIGGAVEAIGDQRQHDQLRQMRQHDGGTEDR